MKKRIFSIIALMLVSLFTLSACDGCSSLPTLKFNNGFYGLSEEEPRTYYTEILTYDVNYAESFEGINLSPKLKDDENVSFEFKDGSYVSTLKVYKGFQEAGEDNGVEIKSDIIENLNEDEQNAFHLHTEFSIKAKYVVNGKTTENDEKIISDAFFLKTALSFAPVYTKTKASYLQFYSSIGEVIKVESESETTYQNNSYTTWRKITGNKASEETTTEQKYSLKSVIDNAQLLFALRNFDVEFEKVGTLAVVSPNYEAPTTLAVNYSKNFTVPYTVEKPLTYSNSVTDTFVNLESTVETKQYAFYKNDSKETGTRQTVFIQSKVESSPLNYLALPIRYIEPLTTYGNFLPMGVLDYTLTSVNIQIGK